MGWCASCATQAIPGSVRITWEGNEALTRLTLPISCVTKARPKTEIIWGVGVSWTQQAGMVSRMCDWGQAW